MLIAHARGIPHRASPARNDTYVSAHVATTRRVAEACHPERAKRVEGPPWQVASGSLHSLRSVGMTRSPLASLGWDDTLFTRSSPGREYTLLTCFARSG